MAGKQGQPSKPMVLYFHLKLKQFFGESKLEINFRKANNSDLYSFACPPEISSISYYIPRIDTNILFFCSKTETDKALNSHSIFFLSVSVLESRRPFPNFKPQERPVVHRAGR